MEQNLDYEKARDLLLSLVSPVKAASVPLSQAAGRILASSLYAAEPVPPFDRSPYDGYAFRAADSAGASRETPVRLAILEEVAAGAVPTKAVTPGTATKILTGAPIPEGADAVVMYEKTEFTAETVTLFAPAKSGENIIRAGEDVRAGQLLAEAGVSVDAGLAGTLASQGVSRPLVYNKPRAGLISTGSELVEVGEAAKDGKIRNSNRYTFTAALQKDGCIPEYLGTVKDSAQEIAEKIRAGLAACDIVFLTGGVSAGDYDLTPAAMELAGVEILVKGVQLKPGMACAYGVKGGKLVCGLSGNPASSLTNYYAVVQPAVRRLAGRQDALPKEFDIALANGFSKKSRGTRLLRGTLVLEDGAVKMRLPSEQGNVVISSAIGCDVMAVVPAGSGALTAGTILKGFMI